MLDSHAPFLGSAHGALSEWVAAQAAISTATTAGNPLDASESAFQARTTTSAERQSNHVDRNINVTRVAASTRFGFTPRSRYSASWAT
jgi:hypothetical protein